MWTERFKTRPSSPGGCGLGAFGQRKCPLRQGERLRMDLRSMTPLRLAILIALIVAAMSPAAHADVTLKGDRVDPCVEMRSWQKLASAAPDNWELLNLVGTEATACAETYGNTDFRANDSIRCDLYLIAGAAFNAASHLMDFAQTKKSLASLALNGYAGASASCLLANRDQDFQKSISASLDRVRSYYFDLPSK